MGEEQEVHLVGLDPQLLERREYQRDGRVGPGIDDRRPAAGHHDVRGVHLRANIFRVDGGDAVGEFRQSWHDCIHGLRQHSSMNRKLLLTIVMIGLGPCVTRRGRRARQPGARQHSGGGHAPDGAPRRLPELAWCKFRRLAARRRPADRHALRRRRAAASRGDAAGRARTAHVLSRAGDRGTRRRNRPWRRASCSSRTQGGNENAQVYWYDTATRAVRMLTDGKGLHGGLVWSHDGRRVAFHGTGRDGVSYDLYIAEPANNVRRRAWCTTAFRRTGRCTTGLPTTPNY